MFFEFYENFQLHSQYKGVRKQLNYFDISFLFPFLREKRDKLDLLGYLESLEKMLVVAFSFSVPFQLYIQISV